MLIAGIVGIVCFAGMSKAAGTNEAGAYLRVHIRANSNEECDQAVKYRVRDRIVSYLTLVVADCETKDEAMHAISARLTEVAAVAEKVLAENGYFYGARADLRKEEFPTRVYEENDGQSVTLQAGVYDALIVELGSGQGDNWWCVVYPPLCFSGGNGNVVYKSKIAEIIQKFYRK